MEYTVDYFIEKFEAIPQEEWVRGDFTLNGCHCAFGHLGCQNMRDVTTFKEAINI